MVQVPDGLKELPYLLMRRALANPSRALSPKRGYGTEVALKDLPIKEQERIERLVLNQRSRRAGL